MNTYIPPMLMTQHLFLKKQTSLNALNYIKSFFTFSGFNVDKCEIAGIGGVLKNVNVALCDTKNINFLTNESTKIFRVHISYKKKIQMT